MEQQQDQIQQEGSKEIYNTIHSQNISTVLSQNNQRDSKFIQNESEISQKNNFQEKENLQDSQANNFQLNNSNLIQSQEKQIKKLSSQDFSQIKQTNSQISQKIPSQDQVQILQQSQNSFKSENKQIIAQSQNNLEEKSISSSKKDFKNSYTEQTYQKKESSNNSLQNSQQSQSNKKSQFDGNFQSGQQIQQNKSVQHQTQKQIDQDSSVQYTLSFMPESEINQQSQQYFSQMQENTSLQNEQLNQKIEQTQKSEYQNNSFISQIKTEQNKSIISEVNSEQNFKQTKRFDVQINPQTNQENENLENNSQNNIENNLEFEVENIDFRSEKEKLSSANNDTDRSLFKKPFTPLLMEHSNDQIPRQKKQKEIETIKKKQFYNCTEESESSMNISNNQFQSQGPQSGMQKGSQMEKTILQDKKQIFSTEENFYNTSVIQTEPNQKQNFEFQNENENENKSQNQNQNQNQNENENENYLQIKNIFPTSETPEFSVQEQINQIENFISPQNSQRSVLRKINRIQNYNQKLEETLKKMNESQFEISIAELKNSSIQEIIQNINKNSLGIQSPQSEINHFLKQNSEDKTNNQIFKEEQILLQNLNPQTEQDLNISENNNLNQSSNIYKKQDSNTSFNQKSQLEQNQLEIQQQYQKKLNQVQNLVESISQSQQSAQNFTNNYSQTSGQNFHKVENSNIKLNQLQQQQQQEEQIQAQNLNQIQNNSNISINLSQTNNSKLVKQLKQNGQFLEDMEFEEINQKSVQSEPLEKQNKGSFKKNNHQQSQEENNQFSLLSDLEKIKNEDNRSQVTQIQNKIKMSISSISQDNPNPKKTRNSYNWSNQENPNSNIIKQKQKTTPLTEQIGLVANYEQFQVSRKRNKDYQKEIIQGVSQKGIQKEVFTSEIASTDIGGKGRGNSEDSQDLNQRFIKQKQFTLGNSIQSLNQRGSLTNQFVQQQKSEKKKDLVEDQQNFQFQQDQFLQNQSNSVEEQVFFTEVAQRRSQKQILGQQQKNKTPQKEFKEKRKEEPEDQLSEIIKNKNILKQNQVGTSRSSFYDEIPQQFEKPQLLQQQLMEVFKQDNDELNKLAQKYFANSPVMQRIKNARDQFLEKQMQIFDRRKTQEQIYHEQQENLKLFQKISMSEQEARLKQAPNQFINSNPKQNHLIQSPFTQQNQIQQSIVYQQQNIQYGANPEYNLPSFQQQYGSNPEYNFTNLQQDVRPFQINARNSLQPGDMGAARQRNQMQQYQPNEYLSERNQDFYYQQQIQINQEFLQSGDSNTNPSIQNILNQKQKQNQQQPQSNQNLNNEEFLNTLLKYEQNQSNLPQPPAMKISQQQYLQNATRFAQNHDQNFTSQKKKSVNDIHNNQATPKIRSLTQQNETNSGGQNYQQNLQGQNFSFQMSNSEQRKGIQNQRNSISSNSNNQQAQNQAKIYQNGQKIEMQRMGENENKINYNFQMTNNNNNHIQFRTPHKQNQNEDNQIQSPFTNYYPEHLLNNQKNGPNQENNYQIQNREDSEADKEPEINYKDISQKKRISLANNNTNSKNEEKTQFNSNHNSHRSRTDSKQSNYSNKKQGPVKNNQQITVYGQNIEYQ